MKRLLVIIFLLFLSVGSYSQIIYTQKPTTPTEFATLAAKKFRLPYDSLGVTDTGNIIFQKSSNHIWIKDTTGYYVMIPNVNDITGGGGSGDIDTASNLGGGLANFSSKSGSTLRFNSFSSSDFDLASNLISIDAALKTDWQTAYTDRLKWDGGSSGLVAATGRTSLGGTTVGQNIFTLTNPSAVTFIRMNADNTVSARTAANLLSDISAEGSFTETIEEFTGSTSTTVTVSNTPKTSKARIVYFNGVRMKNSNLSITGTAFTISGITRETDDIITVKYSY